ncbi:hypothetical protein [Streptomyces pseudovenezuelae]|uniref:Secreted protein n=1 Tax=Streptomyces pseudovenezuelae TaxID=67350 RepID=A0ABT6M5R3_9ACTN|nr:hypothetical protein [Streptomyces pseudovenezuelae]MDH6222974.1 hypothetical protein [Streptomyces pseudovenezuelae]
MLIKTARASKRGSAACGLLVAFAMLLSMFAATPVHAATDPYISAAGEPRVEGISGPWMKMDRPRGEESRNYLPGCARYYVCLYVLSNQTSARNYWYIFRLYDETMYDVYDFNYDNTLQWIIVNQTGGKDAATYDGGPIPDLIQCYNTNDPALETSRNFKSANWYFVWHVRTDVSTC